MILNSVLGSAGYRYCSLNGAPLRISEPRDYGRPRGPRAGDLSGRALAGTSADHMSAEENGPTAGDLGRALAGFESRLGDARLCSVDGSFRVVEAAGTCELLGAAATAQPPRLAVAGGSSVHAGWPTDRRRPWSHLAACSSIHLSSRSAQKRTSTGPRAWASGSEKYWRARNDEKNAATRLPGRVCTLVFNRYTASL